MNEATGSTAGSQGELDWLVARFVERVVGIRSAVVVSSDGLLLACDSRLPSDARQLAAVSSGIVALSQGGAQVLELGTVRRTVVDMWHSTLVVMSVSDRALLAVLTEEGCDLGVAGYHMSRLARQAGDALTPDLRDGPGGQDIPVLPAACVPDAARP
ncbi:roadblock/LC7 domain-containing protein [Streptomyces vinaceus]|uniref:roadblock/LC7 domain-containing protein n=1 Tax=Streptomyces vinaceus TaxID=1960 RepID=UPI00380A2DCD